MNRPKSWAGRLVRFFFKPFGASRRIVIGDQEYYQFPTVWNDVELKERMNKENPVDPLDARYWKPRNLN